MHCRSDRDDFSSSESDEIDGNSSVPSSSAIGGANLGENSSKKSESHTRQPTPAKDSSIISNLRSQSSHFGSDNNHEWRSDTSILSSPKSQSSHFGSDSNHAKFDLSSIDLVDSSDKKLAASFKSHHTPPSLLAVQRSGQKRLNLSEILYPQKSPKWQSDSSSPKSQSSHFGTDYNHEWRSDSSIISNPESQSSHFGSDYNHEWQSDSSILSSPKSQSSHFGSDCNHEEWQSDLSILSSSSESQSSHFGSDYNHEQVLDEKFSSGTSAFLDSSSALDYPSTNLPRSDRPVEDGGNCVKSGGVWRLAANMADSIARIFLNSPDEKTRDEALRIVGVENYEEFNVHLGEHIHELLKIGQSQRKREHTKKAIISSVTEISNVLHNETPQVG